jgi:hypothetical protein
MRLWAAWPNAYLYQHLTVLTPYPNAFTYPPLNTNPAFPLFPYPFPDIPRRSGENL